MHKKSKTIIWVDLARMRYTLDGSNIRNLDKILFFFFPLEILSYSGSFVIVNREYKPVYDNVNSIEYLQFTESIATTVSFFSKLINSKK